MANNEVRERLFFSASHGGFFSSELHDAIPDDAVEITAADHAALMEGQDNGQRIAAAPDGSPMLVDRVRITTRTDVKAEAYRRIAQVMPEWMVAREVSGGAPIPDAVKAYAEAVRGASDRLETLDPIPMDYTDDRYWPVTI